MPPAHQQIVDAVQSVLAGGGTVAAARVFLYRFDPLQPDEMPAIFIAEEPDGESVEPYTVHGLERRELAVSVTGVVTHGTTAAADAGALGLQINKLIATSTTLAALAKLGVQIVANRLVIDGSADRLFASRQQSWRFSYLVQADSPDIIF